jgi:hypothetical protein
MRAHPPHSDPTRVSASERVTGGAERRCYEIRVRGPTGPTAMQAFPALTATRSGYDTLLTGPLADQSALHGVINRLEALGLQLLEIRRLRSAISERWAKSHHLSEDDSSHLPSCCTSINNDRG